MVHNMLTTEELNQLKSQLPRGYFSKILAVVPFSERTVSKFFTGKTYKEEIHLAALELIQADRKTKKQLYKQHKSLLNNE